MSTLLAIVDAQFLGVVAVFFRVGAFFGLLPGFGEATVSIRIKLLASLAFTTIVYPLVPTTPLVNLALPQLVTLCLAETLVGLTLGIGFRLLVIGLQTAGTIAAQSTSLSQVFGNSAIEPMPAMGHILVVGGLALAMMADLHVKAAVLFVASYDLFPAGLGIAGNGLAPWGISQVAHAFRLGFTLAVPFLVLSMLYNLALGVINKAMPQLMVAMVGAPAITMGGLFMLFVTAPLMLELWRTALEGYLQNPMGLR